MLCTLPGAEAGTGGGDREQRKGVLSALLKQLDIATFLQNLCFTAINPAFNELLLCAHPLSLVGLIYRIMTPASGGREQHWPLTRKVRVAEYCSALLSYLTIGTPGNTPGLHASTLKWGQWNISKRAIKEHEREYALINTAQRSGPRGTDPHMPS